MKAVFLYSELGYLVSSNWWEPVSQIQWSKDFSNAFMFSSIDELKKWIRVSLFHSEGVPIDLGEATQVVIFEITGSPTLYVGLEHRHSSMEKIPFENLTDEVGEEAEDEID